MTRLSRAAFILMVSLALACGEDAAGDSDAGDGSEAADASGAETGPSSVYIDLGTVTENSDVSFEVPDNALGFQVVVSKAEGTGSVGVRSIIGPNGEVLVAEHTPDQAAVPVLQVQAGVASAIIPQSSSPAAMAVAPGLWTAQFSGTGALRAGVYIRQSVDGEFHGGTLDVTVYIPEGLTISDPTPVHVVDADTASSDAAVNARLDSFFASFEEFYGIGRGEVRFIELDAEFVDVEYSELGTVLSKTIGEDSGGAHFVFVNELSFQGNPLWGTSSGLPGSSTSTGHATSGMVIDISLGLGAIADGKTMVHELGHFAGLFHTTEMGASFHDTLSDTPECIDTSDVLTCPDRTNIMFATFWGATGGVGIEVSEHQRRIVQASPLYRAAPAGAPLVPGGSLPQAEHASSIFSPLEARLLTDLCAHAPPSAHASPPSPRAIEELRTIADSSGKPSILRQRARQALDQATLRRIP